mmetsp:Transcript_23011/g.41185  ORF Transcript_23011/g.41185 Transcript_23011/m.41185 type:complete len:327 (-) Transcript_23011:53-1033(-)
MLLEECHNLLVSHVEDPCLHVEAAGGHEILHLLAQESGAVDCLRVGLQRPKHDALLEVPNDNLLVIRGCAHHLLGGVEIDSVHLILVSLLATSQLGKRLACLMVPEVHVLVARGAPQDVWHCLGEGHGIQTTHLLLGRARASQCPHNLVRGKIVEVDGGVPGGSGDDVKLSAHRHAVHRSLVDGDRPFQLEAFSICSRLFARLGTYNGAWRHANAQLKARSWTDRRNNRSLGVDLRREFGHVSLELLILHAKLLVFCRELLDLLLKSHVFKCYLIHRVRHAVHQIRERAMELAVHGPIQPNREVEIRHGANDSGCYLPTEAQTMSP